MSVVTSMLWKEWRDHRAPLLAFPLAIAPLIALGVALLPQGMAQNATLPTFVALGGLAIAALTLGADLLPGEEQRGTIALLRRLPGGLTRAFLAKAAIGLLACAGFCASAWLWTTLASATLRGGPWFPGIDLGSTSRMVNSARYSGQVEWWPLVVLVAAWIVPVSAWLPRGALAAPATAFVLALALGPLALRLADHPWLLPPARELQLAGLAWILAAPLVAGLSFVLGRRRGGGPRASAWRGLLLTALVVAPGYARLSALASEWRLLDPGAIELRFDYSDRAFLGADGRHAFVSVARPSDTQAVSHALVVDLANGSWKELGEAGDRFASIATNGDRNPVPFVSIYPGKRVESSLLTPTTILDRLSRWVAIDAATLDVVARAALVRANNPFHETSESAAVERAANSVRRADGARAWWRVPDVVAEASDGTIRVLPDSRFDATFVERKDLGFQFRKNGKPTVYDVTRERRFDLPDDIREVWVRPGRWVVERSIGDSTDRETCLFDPETSVYSPRPPGVPRWGYEGVLPDGRMLAFRGDRTQPGLGRIVRVDPESGVIEEVALPAAFEGRVEKFFVEATTPSGAPVLALDPPGWAFRRHGRFDAASCSIAISGTSKQATSELLGCLDETSAIVLQLTGTLTRERFGSEEVEILFPAAERGRR